jgi:Holliday junction resolvase RusA-like endonuclease
MIEPVTSFIIPGEPVGKGRARSTRTGHHYTPEKTRNYEETVGYIALQSMQGSPPTRKACRIEIYVHCAIPKSASKKMAEKMLNGTIRPTKKPDTDNVLKIVKDACNRIVYEDDCQVVEDEVKKFYTKIPDVGVYVNTWSEVE